MRMLEVFISPAIYDPVTQHCGKSSDIIVCLLLKHLIRHGESGTGQSAAAEAFYNSIRTTTLTEACEGTQAVVQQLITMNENDISGVKGLNKYIWYNPAATCVANRTEHFKIR